MDDIHDCWTCAKFKKLNPQGSHECTADVKGGTQYEGWKPPCANWEPSSREIGGSARRRRGA